MEKDDKILKLKEALASSDAILIGAGAGLSTSAGFTYKGERFNKYFFDFEAMYHFHDMYSGGFYPYESNEEHFAYWSRYIYINRYMNAPFNVYEKLYGLVKDKDYFVLTTNVDHCFQKAGFDKKRLFYMQGDYGLFQCSLPCHDSTYDNEEMIKKMVLSQGFELDKDGELFIPDGVKLKMTIPSALIPHCPKCGRVMCENLRSDETFVQDEGWYRASMRYSDFIRRHKNMHILFLECGVGYNTPGIIKYQFWQMTAENPRAIYACINKGEAYAPVEIKDRSICINGDVGRVLEQL